MYPYNNFLLVNTSRLQKGSSHQEDVILLITNTYASLMINKQKWNGIYCDDHSSLHLQPQYKYELFHIYFTSLHCTGKYELNKLTSLPMCGFIAQLVEHRTGIRGGHGFESR